jgi:uncharacterized protein DUF6356
MRATLRRLFTEHPGSIGETYAEHASHAAGYGAFMLLGALACFVHAAVPGVCTSTGSRITARLYDRIVVNRSRLAPHVHRLSAPSQTEFMGEHI